MKVIIITEKEQSIKIKVMFTQKDIIKINLTEIILIETEIMREKEEGIIIWVEVKDKIGEDFKKIDLIDN